MPCFFRKLCRRSSEKMLKPIFHRSGKSFHCTILQADNTEKTRYRGLPLVIRLSALTEYGRDHRLSDESRSFTEILKIHLPQLFLVVGALHRVGW